MTLDFVQGVEMDWEWPIDTGDKKDKIKLIRYMRVSRRRLQLRKLCSPAGRCGVMPPAGALTGQTLECRHQLTGSPGLSPTRPNPDPKPRACEH